MLSPKEVLEPLGKSPTMHPYLQPLTPPQKKCLSSKDYLTFLKEYLRKVDPSQ